MAERPSLPSLFPAMSYAPDFDQIFDRMMRRWPFDRRERASAEPRALRAFHHMSTVEVKENGKAYIVTVELPGLEDKDVKVEVEDDVLTISGREEGRAERRQDTLFGAQLWQLPALLHVTR
jgi:HSP20 family protein